MNWNGVNVLVTGGAGHIGSHLVKKLVDSGAHVKVADNLWRGSKKYLLDEANRPIIDMENDFMELDLREFKNCEKALEGIDIVYHLADIVAGIEYVFSNEVSVFRSNMLINSNMFKAAADANIGKLAYAGAACAYPLEKQNDPNHPLFKESDMYPAHPESAYGWGKLMGEYECELYSQGGIMDTRILRLHNVYGPHCDLSPEKSQVVPATIRKAINYPDEEFVIWGSGKQSRSFLYVSDAVDGLMRIIDKDVNKGPVQIGNDKKTTINEIADLVIEVSGKKISKQYDLNKPEGDFGRAADCTLAKNVLNWEPKVSLREGIEKTYEWAENFLKNQKN